MELIKNRIYSLPGFSEMDQFLKNGKNVQLFGLSGSLRAFPAGYLSETCSRPVLIIPADSDSGEKFRDDLEVILGEKQVAFFPVFENKPYDQGKSYSALNRLRIDALQKLMAIENPVVIAPVNALLTKTPNPEQFLDRQLYLKRGNNYDFENLPRLLTDAGYSRVDLVEDVGNFAVRGGIVDIYCWNSDDPVRLEFFGDQLESVRFFNVINQRSLNEADETIVLPDVKSAANSGTVFDFLPKNTVIFYENHSQITDTAKEYLELAAERFAELNRENIFPEAPAERYISLPGFQSGLKKYHSVRLDFIRDNSVEKISFASVPPPTFTANIERFVSFSAKARANGKDVFVLCDTQAQADRLKELLDEEKVAAEVQIRAGALHNGFLCDQAGLFILTDHEIFDRFKRRKTYRRFKNGEYLRSLKALKLYDYVVHIDYGIGQYMGLSLLESNGTRREVIKLEYAEGDVLFVSVDRLNRVQKYASDEGVIPKITKLGTGEWDKLKKKTRESVEKIATDLIKLYAERKSRKGISFSQDTHWQKELELAFEYEETEDQRKSIEEVKSDLESSQPMDRLLCGDVGYGKTEVAIRAAFKVVMDGKQVAVLVPTTILAYQHYQTFHERMSGFPVNIEMLSRFRSKKEQAQALEKLEKGRIDIIIGTHRLLSDDVKFKNLALLIIDEEQRFGVRHKEKLKMMRATVDVLTMTATPIPRTLHMSLMGSRDLSHIETPPRNRMPVITEVHNWDEDLVRLAINRELDRKGQVYFVHNRVQSIAAIRAAVQEIVPHARIAVAHGQLPEKTLEKIMLDFIHRKYDILISTMIIENGLDIPNVNTIMIDRADRFGLAQLYQLRGRVGRSDKQAYAYLLLKPGTKLTDLAQKRLRAIQDFTDLGSGFKLALRDMEIRGIGNILGKQQSGFVQSVGFDLYCKILEEAVAQLKEEKMPDETILTKKRSTDPKIDVDFDLILPGDYIFNETERITLYHRLVNFSDIAEIEDMKMELTDRFGAPPPEVTNLMDTIEVKVLAGQIYASHVILKGNQLKLKFSNEVENNERFYKEIIPAMMAKNELKVKFSNEKQAFGIKLEIKGETVPERLSNTKNILKNV